MGNKNEPPLDEIQWHNPAILAEMQGIHSNSVLYYFAGSPFFDPTSNNAVVVNQAMFNQAMRNVLGTREAFEAHLRSMSGLEYVVAQEPAEMGPGMGTGVWVIRKQTRRKRNEPGVEDDITVHADYFVVGENIYQAPTLGDILSAKIVRSLFYPHAFLMLSSMVIPAFVLTETSPVPHQASLSSAVGKIFPAASSIQQWSPAQGHVYKQPTASTSLRTKGLESKEGTPMPESITKALEKTSKSAPDSRLAEDSLMIHLRYGGEYMDENPITGKPGEFHLSSTGRKDKVPPPVAGKPNGLKPASEASPLTKDAKADKNGKAATAPPKPKRRKSKGGTVTPS